MIQLGRRKLCSNSLVVKRGGKSKAREISSFLFL